MQIAAVGAQDKHIATHGPSIIPDSASFFTKVYRQPVPFALELREQMFSRTVRFGETHSVTLFRDAEFIGEMYLEIVLPRTSAQEYPSIAAASYRWCDDIGHALIRAARLKIDGTIVHEHDKYVHAALDALTLPIGKIAAKKEMIGGARKLYLNEPHTIYVPLAFYHARKGHGWLPLWALRASVVSVEIDLEQVRNVVVYTEFGVDTSRPQYPGMDLESITFESNIVENQARIVKTVGKGMIRLLYQSAFISHEALDFHRDEDVLIEQIQKTEIENYSQIDTDTLMIKRNFSGDLPFANSVKYLFWTVSVAEEVTRKKEVTPPWKALKEIIIQNRYFEFMDAIDTATLVFDGRERFREQYGSSLRTVNPYNCALRIDPSSNVYVYSFALDADSYQPTGSAYMSGISQKTLRIDLKFDNIPVVVRVFGVGYNVLQCREGKGTLQFTA
jgi:hypothetical protein